MNRDKALLSLRPIIKTDDNSRTTSMEAFQNTTLRPILKFQNNLLMKYFLASNRIVKIPFEKKTDFDKRELINKTLKEDHKLKDLIYGAITALMTSDEMDVYFENKSELKRRINTMAIERLIDQIVGS